MRRSGHPSRPRAITCCFFASLKTLLIPTKATALRRNQRPRGSFSLAGFQVTLIGRFWVTAEGLGEFTVADSKKALPLQAADLLAYEAFKYVQFAKGDKNVEVRPQYALALKNFRSIEDFRLFDEERMNGLMKAITTAYGQ